MTLTAMLRAPVLLGVLACAAPTLAAAEMAVGLVTRDRTPLLAAAQSSGAVHTWMWRGEALEIRSERGDYLQVWDYHRERGGYVPRSHLLRVDEAAASAEQLLAVLGYVADQPASEALSLGLASAVIQNASVAALNGPAGARVLDILGTQAERLAARASAGASDASTSAHLDVAARHGIQYRSVELDGVTRLCYDGDAFRRLLLLRAASAEQKARAALALTTGRCSDADAPLSQRETADLGFADILSRVTLGELPPHWRNRVAVRRAHVWSRIAFARARRGEPAAAAAGAEASASLAAVSKPDLTDEDSKAWNEAAIQANAGRWAAAPGAVPGAMPVTLRVLPKSTGETCLQVLEPSRPGVPPAAEACTWGVVWTASASANREGTAVAIAVQPNEGWRELWVFRKTEGQWRATVIPPAGGTPGIGYAELAGWVPGGRQMLVAREARTEGRAVRRFEVLDLPTLAVARQASDPSILGAFTRWPDPAWKQASFAVR